MSIVRVAIILVALLVGGAAFSILWETINALLAGGGQASLTRLALAVVALAATVAVIVRAVGPGSERRGA